MTTRISVISAIIKKDLLGLLPLVFLAAAVFFLEPIIADLELDSDSQFWSMLKTNFYWLSYFMLSMLVVSVIQLDPAASLTHDWLTRPIARLNWLVAKTVFLLLTVCIPIILARTLVNLSNDYSMGVALLNATAIESPAGLLPMPFLFTIALLTGTLRRAIFLVIAIVMILILPAWSATQPLFDFLGVNLSPDYDALMWIQAIPITVAGMAAILLVYWYQYCRRQTGRAFLIFSIMLVLVFFSMFPPSSLYNWESAIAIQKSLINGPDEELEEYVILDHARACFPAEIVGSDFGNAVLEQAAWQEHHLTNAGSGALTFATTVNTRRILVEWVHAENLGRELTVDWRIDRLRTQGRFSANSLTADFYAQRSSTAVNRFSPITASDTDYWLVPGAVAAQLAHDPSTELTLEFDLTLLSPSTYELKTDGQRRHFSELGYCSARINSVSNSIEVECVKRGPQPAMVSAELVGIKSSRVDSNYQPNYKASWLDRIGVKRYELAIAASNLVDNSSILLTAYKLERILRKQLVSNGFLGSQSSTCPAPMDSQFAAVERSSWSDKSPHEVSSIAVDRGVRLEVLDWRTAEQATPDIALANVTVRSTFDGSSNVQSVKPTLVLIPGLGATAHSFDDLAVKLSEKYPVVAMTRRGTGDSSKPEYGYDLQRLSLDVLQVIATLGIETPILVGHSMASEELSFIGANYSDRVAGLIYLDAAYDRTKVHKELRALEALLPPTPAPIPAEFVSYETARLYAERIGSAGNLPEGEVLASYEFATGTNKHVSRFIEAIQRSAQSPDYSRISIPALGIFALPSSPEALMKPWYDQSDPQLLETLREKYRLEKAWRQEQISRFDHEIENSEVLAIPDANHWIFLSHEAEVLQAIDRFIMTLDY